MRNKIILIHSKNTFSVIFVFALCISLFFLVTRVVKLVLAIFPMNIQQLVENLLKGRWGKLGTPEALINRIAEHLCNFHDAYFKFLHRNCVLRADGSFIYKLKDTKK